MSADRVPSKTDRKFVVSLLLVDDEPALLEIGQAFLERTDGVTVTTADSARADPPGTGTNAV